MNDQPGAWKTFNGCTCFRFAPCSFCESLTEEETDAFCNGGMPALIKKTAQLEMSQNFALTDTAEVKQADITGMLHWSQWALRNTREGQRMHRYASIRREVSKTFWDSWRHDKPGWQRAGFSPSKDDLGNWTLNQWLTVDGKVSDSSLARAKESESDATANWLPIDWMPDTLALTSPQSQFLYGYQRDPALRLKGALSGILPPPGHEKQILAGLNGNALDASDTGTGKTIVALVVCAELGLKPCVIAPLAVLQSWTRAAKMLNVPLGWVINYDKIRTGRSGLGRWRDAQAIDPSARHAGQVFQFEYLPGNGKHILIFDEVQKCKAHDSKQGQILRDAAKAGHKCLGLSATAAKDPTEMRNLGAMLGLHDGSEKSFTEFQKYYGCYETGWGYRYDAKAKKRLEELHRVIFPLRGQRIRVSEVPDFPETTISADALDTGNTQTIKDAYEEMERKLAEAATKSAREKGSMTLAAIMAARVASEAGKLDLFQSLAEEAIEEGRSVAIFLNFRAHIGELAERLKTSSIIWGTSVVRNPNCKTEWMDGRAQKPDERQAIIDNFQQDKERFVIVSLQAGGAGISLHDQFHGNHPRLSLISPSFSAIDLKQGLGRVHRAGAKTKSFQRIIFAAGTIEEDICQSMRLKLANIETLNDGAMQPAGLAERLQGVKLEGEIK